MGRARTGPSKRPLGAAFLGLLAVSAALKFALAFAFADLPAHYDEVEYLEFGRRIADDGVAPVLWRAPGYQWFVALGLSLTPGSPLGVRLLQCLASLAATALVFRIGRARWGDRAGLIAAALVAFFPSDIAFSHLLWSEALYGTLVLAAFERLLAAFEHRRVSAGVAAGLLLGAATLTRSTGAVLVAASLGWLLSGGRSWRREASAVFIGWALVVAPWSMNASARAGRFVLVDTNSGFNFWSGNNSMIPKDVGSLWCVGLPLENGGTPPGPLGTFLPVGNWRDKVRALMENEGILDPEGPGGDAWYRRQAIAEIRRDPGAALARIPRKVAAFWAPDFFLPRHIARDWYGPIAPSLAVALVTLTVVAAAVPLLGGPAALGALGAGPFASLAIVWTLATAVLHAVAYGHSRMHAPLTPILMLAVIGAFHERPTLARLLRRGVPWTLLALGLWILATPIVAGLYLGPSPRHDALADALGTIRRAPLPGTRWVAWMRAGSAESRGELEEAEEILEGGPWAEDPWTIFLLGRIELTRADPANVATPSSEAWARALPFLERAASLDPDSDSLALAAIHAFREVGRTDDAEALLERVRARRREVGMGR